MTKKISKKRRLADIEVRAEIDKYAQARRRGLRQLRQQPGAMPTTQGGG